MTDKNPNTIPAELRFPIMYGAARRHAFEKLESAEDRRAFLSVQDPDWAAKQTV